MSSFHWLSPTALEAFASAGTLRPSWRHYLLDAGRFVRGISTAEEPMLWSPDEELPREPCLVIDRTRIAHTIHAVDSSEAFHLTKDIARG